MHRIDKISKQELDEAKYYRKCYGDRGGCYPPRSKVKVDNTLRGLSSLEFVSNNCLLFLQMSQTETKTYFG